MSALDFFLLHHHRSECIYLARNTTQFKITGRQLESSQIHQYTFKQMCDCCVHSEEKSSLLFYYRLGWMKPDSAKWQERDLLMMGDI